MARRDSWCRRGQVHHLRPRFRNSRPSWTRLFAPRHPPPGRPRRVPAKGLPRPDLGVLQIGLALAYLMAGAVLGVTLAFSEVTSQSLRLVLVCSKVLVRGDDRSRTVSVDLPGHGSMEISTAPSGGGVSPGGAWGLLASSAGLVTLEYRTTLKLQYRPHAANAKAIRRWFDNTSEMISRFDWATIDSKLERDLVRRSLVRPTPASE